MQVGGVPADGVQPGWVSSPRWWGWGFAYHYSAILRSGTMRQPILNVISHCSPACLVPTAEAGPPLFLWLERVLRLCWETRIPLRLFRFWPVVPFAHAGLHSTTFPAVSPFPPPFRLFIQLAMACQEASLCVDGLCRHVAHARGPLRAWSLNAALLFFTLALFGHPA